MPRKPRYYLPGVPVHIVQRGHSREPIFFETQDYATYAYWLNERAKKYDVAIDAFVLILYTKGLVAPPKRGTKPIVICLRGRSRKHIKLILEAWQSGTPLGSDRFNEKVQQRLQCKVAHARRGRPANSGKGL
ncbi:MAG: REP element-mobilizing transposase RayT [Paracoccaceae bacterium]|jgi:REP element-mobilizing transposase RayT